MRLPGGSILAPKPPKVEAPPPLPTREDPSVKEARQKERLSQRRRRGRRASRITGPEASLGEPNVTRPEGRSATLLGN